MIKIENKGKYVIIFTKEQHSHGVETDKGFLIDGTALRIANKSIDQVDYIDCPDISEYLKCDTNYNQIIERWKVIEGREGCDIECYILVFVDCKISKETTDGSEQQSFRILTTAGKLLKEIH